MPNHKAIYTEEAARYELLVSHEDYEGNLLKVIQRITALEGKDVIDLGAGTGRLTCLLAPFVHSIAAFDASEQMLQVAADKLGKTGLTNWRTGVADHRHLPVEDQSIDLCISGWSICYLVDWNRQAWRAEVEAALAEMNRVLKPGGSIVIIETQGTGFTFPHPPDHLVEYFRFLDKLHFQSTWFRTDYCFDNEAQALESSTFFFGEEIKQKIEGVKLPECTGLWWKPRD
jgi:ubiquinone/menaquinone biosynthesis C-methylase UbiE